MSFICFFVISSNLLLLKKNYINPGFSLTLQEFLRAVWEAVFWAIVLSKTLNKLNSQFLYCGVSFQSMKVNARSINA